MADSSNRDAAKPHFWSAGYQPRFGLLIGESASLEDRKRDQGKAASPQIKAGLTPRTPRSRHDHAEVAIKVQSATAPV